MSNPLNDKTSIIGGGQAGAATPASAERAAIHKTNSRFWNTRGSDLLGETALPHYGAFVSEEKHRLFGDVAGKALLEIGCGSGQSLQYQGQRGAAELWGLDISEQQLEKAARRLAECGLTARLVCAPMEEDCGIPAEHFDYVYSVYAIGWATSLEGTFRRIAAYLKKGGVFIFSWSHPIHTCVAAENGTLTFKKSYFDEDWYSATLGESTLTLADRKLSTYVNALAKAGFALEEMVEETDEEMLPAPGGEEEDDFAKKARMLPVTFVIKARKL